MSLNFNLPGWVSGHRGKIAAVLGAVATILAQHLGVPQAIAAVIQAVLGPN